MTEQCGAIYEGEICRRYKGHLSRCDYLPMTITEQIKALPKDETLHTLGNLSYSGDGYETNDTGVTTDDLIALAESHERLLATAQAVITARYTLDTPDDESPFDELQAAIGEAEKL